MKRLVYIIAFVAALASCSDSYLIQGSSSVSQLDGSKLYLKVLKDKELTNFDSCEVVHGKFRFSGILDTTILASLYMDNQSIMPLVVEKGDINISIENMQRRVSGSPLNDLLYDYLDKYERLQNQLKELSHRESQMLLDGIDEAEIGRTLLAEAAVITQEEDSLVTDFVVANFENVLGPFAFQMCTSVPQVEHILSKAPAAFKNHPMVVEFYQYATGSSQAAADEPSAPQSPSDIDDATIQDILNGKEDTH